MDPIEIPDMDRLATFIAVARTGSFREAARERHMSHSTVQKHMRTLEKQLGFELFYRSGRNVLLKPIGHQLTDSAQSALEACEDLHAQIERMRNTETSGVRIACAPVHMAHALGVTIRRFCQEHTTDIQVMLTPREQFKNPTSLTNLIHNGKADVAVTVHHLDNCISTPLWPIHLVAVLPGGDQRRKTSPIESFAGQTIFAQESTMWSRQQLERLAAIAKIDLEIITEPLPEVCIALANSGMGIAVIANDDVQGTRQKFVSVVDSNGKRITNTVRANWHPDNASKNLVAFVKFIQKDLNTGEA